MQLNKALQNAFWPSDPDLWIALLENLLGRDGRRPGLAIPSVQNGQM